MTSTTLSPSTWGVMTRSTDEAWTSKRGAASATFTDPFENMYFSTVLRSNGAGTLWADLARGIILFDGSALAGSTITSAYYRMYAGDSASDDDFAQSIGLVGLESGTPAGATVANSDYAVAGYTTGTLLTNTVAMADIVAYWNSVRVGMTFFFTVVQPWDWTFNAAGLAYLQSAVDGSGTIKLGVLLESDRTNSEPGLLAFSSSAMDWAGIPLFISNDSLPSNGPELFIEYTSGPVNTARYVRASQSKIIPSTGVEVP